MPSIPETIERLAAERTLPDAALKELLENSQADPALFSAADKRRREIYGDAVYHRGLIEFSNYCRNNCYYCGIRRSNRKAVRYRLSREEILSCCQEGYGLGYRTFVLQSGEDPYYTDSLICEIVSSIRNRKRRKRHASDAGGGRRAEKGVDGGNKHNANPCAGGIK